MYAIKNVKILNGHIDMEPIEGMAIIVNDGKIEDIVEEGKIPADAQIHDFQGQYVLPGLINLHVHTPTAGKPTKKKLDYAKVAKLLNLSLPRFTIKKMCENHVKMELYSGCTTIRAVGGVFDFDTKTRDKINKTEIIGPRILAANTAISVPNGHMTGSVALPAHNVEEVIEMVHRLDKENVDFIKLMITGGVLDAEVPGEPGTLRMPAEYVKAACDEAHKLGYKVAAHVEGVEGLKVALENGVDTIEHGARPTKEIIDLFKKNNSCVVATISPALPFSLMSQDVTGYADTDLINGKALLCNMLDCYKECLKNDIPVGLGTDTGCPYITHYDFWRELCYFVKYCDVSPAFAIHSATEVNAKIANLFNETGSIDIGKSADMLVVKNNPLKDLSTLRNPSKVIYKGKIHSDIAIKKLDNVEHELDKLL